MLRSITFGLALLAFSACNNNKPEPLSNDKKTSLMVLGDSISAQAQHALLQNVAEAIQKGGTDYAVTFCNIRAVPLTDSIAASFNVAIKRLSDKNRNPNNAIQTQMDSIAWNKIKSEKAGFVEQDKTGEIYYYKPILIAAPACIKCHGNQTDITESTQKILAQKYPNDKATDYKMGDLRGMWKIKIKEKK